MNLISIFTDISTDQSSELQKKPYKDMTCENSTFHEEGTCELIKLDTKNVMKEQWHANIIGY